MLSIITITKNDNEGLKRTLLSTRRLCTSFREIEHIIIDGSDHDKAEVNRVLCTAELNVNYFVRQPRGISDAFNCGIAMAKYRWIWFLNGGDEVYQELDHPCFWSLLSNVDADVLVFQLRLMQKAVTVKAPFFYKLFPPVSNWIPHPSTIINIEVFKKHGLFNESYKIAMDYEFWMRISTKDVVLNLISIPIATYDQTGISSTEISCVSLEGKKVLVKYRRQLFKSWLNSAWLAINQFRYFRYKSRYENRL